MKHQVLAEIEYRIPVYLLIMDANGLDGGSTDQDERDYWAYIEMMNDKTANLTNDGSWTASYDIEESDFYYYNDVTTQGGDCCDVLITFFGVPLD